MYPEINLVAQSGIVKWPSLKYNAKGQPEFRFTLAKSGAYPWSMPCCAIGHTAEKLAGDLDEGMPIVLSAAELCFRKRDTKTGVISRMEVLVWRVQVGHPTVAAETSPGDVPNTEDEGSAFTSEAPSVPETKKARKPRLPKHLQQPWVASRLAPSEN